MNGRGRYRCTSSNGKKEGRGGGRKVLVVLVRGGRGGDGEGGEGVVLLVL